MRVTRRCLRATATTEFLLMMPLLLAGMLAIITYSLALLSQQMAANAAAHAARVAAVSQVNRGAAARSAGRDALAAMEPMSATWAVEVCDGTVTGSCTAAPIGLGGISRVEIHWESPNFVGAFVPGLPNGALQGVTSATFRNEGW